MLENKQVEKIMNTTDSNLSLSLSPIELATVLSFVSADSVIGIPSDLLSSSQEQSERFQAGVDSLVSRHILIQQDGTYDGDPLLFCMRPLSLRRGSRSPLNQMMSLVQPYTILPAAGGPD